MGNDSYADCVGGDFSVCFLPVCRYSSMRGRQWETKLLSCVRMEPRSMAVAELAGVISLAYETIEAEPF